MKYLKTKNISKFSIKDNTLLVNPYTRITIDSTDSLLLPKGSTAQRPGYDPADPDVVDYSKITGIRIDGDLNGSIRYNSTLHQVEAYINGYWEVVRGAGGTTITKQTLGPGDDIETDFGPLSVVPDSEDEILVFVENVFQISTTNFTIDYNYSGSGNAYLIFSSPVPSTKNITIYYGFAN
jgi:hypothetical protein